MKLRTAGKRKLVINSELKTYHEELKKHPDVVVLMEKLHLEARNHCANLIHQSFVFA